MHGILPIICDPRLFEYFVRVCLFTTESTNHLFCPHTIKTTTGAGRMHTSIVTSLLMYNLDHTAMFVLQYYSSNIYNTDGPTDVLANTNTHI
jgi:hypothetical protein